MKNKKILFPTDFSKHSISALEDTIKLNRLLGAELIIFHAYHRPYSDSYDQETMLEDTERDIDNTFASIEKKVPDLKSQKYSFRKELGDFVDLVTELVNKESVGLIVMSTKGAVGLGELFGTKTAKIIKSVDIPIVVVPDGTHLAGLKSIGLACDYSEKADYDKLDILIELAESVNLEIDIVTMNRQEKTMTKRELANREHVLELMEHLDTRVSFTHHDNVKQGLIDYCKQNEIGLISVLPKSYNYIERIFHDSLTMKIAFHSPVPLLVLQ